jgi:hypothetical protein
MDIDTSKPNPGRIYDYLLGGDHNFPADRAAAERLVQLAPMMPHWMRLNRWFLYYAVDQLAAGKFSCYIDLATGLPTQGYLHERVAEDARIIYNDIDPATVMFARQIIGDRPTIRYIQSDARDIDRILGEAEKLFGAERCVGISMVGISYFLDDDGFSQAARKLYDWAAPGSRMALSYATFPREEHEVGSMYAKMGASLFPRTGEEVQQLVAPWRLLEPGLRSLVDVAEEQLGAPIPSEMLGSRETMSGGIFEK